MMRSAALPMSALRPTSTGDLPPSSSVTGTRLAAAAVITARPTAVEPVNTRWAQGWALNSVATSTPPLTSATTSGAKCSASAAASTAAVRGAISDGFSMARLPAASTLASGENRVYRGAFQVPMMPTTPFGWYCTQAVAPKPSNGATLGRGCAGIHSSRWSRACLSEASDPRISFIIENTAGRPPKSSSIAAHSASLYCTSRSIALCRRALRTAALTGPSAAKARCCASSRARID